MPPTDSPEGNTVELPNPVEEDYCPQPLPYQQDNLLFKSSPVPSEGSAMMDPSSALSSKSSTAWIQTPAEKKKSEPVALLSYLAHKDADGEKVSEMKSMDSLPILTPIFTQNRLLQFPNISLSDTEKDGDDSVKYFSSENGHALNGLLPHASRLSLPNTNSSASLVTCNDKDSKGEPESSTESLHMMTIQVFIPFLIAGFGMVGAGLVLDKVQHWEVFQKISAIYVVVPPLLGLKGNLEMTLASRLSTLSNLGAMDSKKSKLAFIGGNMVISQCLASVVGFLTSLVAVLIGSVQQQEFILNHSLLLIASSVATAAASSCILDSIMVMVILISRNFGINPDNVATPIAASLGDITTTGLLAGIATALYGILGKIVWVGPLVTGMFLILVPLWIYLAWRQPYTADALKTTCVPVIGAMFISTGGGLILDVAVKKYVDLAVFQPIINGVGGNLVAIQVSRIATSLHQSTSLGKLPSFHPSICISPIGVFFSRDKHTRCAQILMLMVIPGQLMFIFTTSYISTGKAVLTFSFVCVYLVASLLQVAILLYIATILTYLVWRFKIDPDNFSIPLLTALGDLLGIGLLTVAYLILEGFGERAVLNSK